MSLADRLKPYQVAHQLVHRLEPYQVSRPVSQFRTASWNTLLFWSMLLDSDDEHIHEHHGDEEGYVYYSCPICGLDRTGGRSFVPYSEFDVWFGRVKA